MIYTRKLLEECERNPALAKFRRILAEHAEMVEELSEIVEVLKKNELHGSAMEVRSLLNRINKEDKDNG